MERLHIEPRAERDMPILPAKKARLRWRLGYERPHDLPPTLAAETARLATRREPAASARTLALAVRHDSSSVRSTCACARTAIFYTYFGSFATGSGCRPSMAA